MTAFEEPQSFHLTEELHKLFQYIDDQGKGFLEVSEVLGFQAMLAASKSLGANYAARGGGQGHEGR